MRVKLDTSERIKDLRVEKHLTLEQLAELTGLSSSAIGKYEGGEYKDISAFAIAKLADKLVSTRRKYARVCSIFRKPIDSVIYFSCTRLLLSAALSRMI